MPKCANECGRRCPMSELAAEQTKKLAETYAKLLDAAQKLENAETAPEFLQVRAWQRAEQAGRALDEILSGWEKQTCPALCFDCAWRQTERGLAIINTLTPCNQWFVPELFNLSKQDKD